MNVVFSDICHKILGEYTEQNSHLSQLLYLVCYMSEREGATDISQIIKVLKRLNKEVSNGKDLMYNILCDGRKKTLEKLTYGEDYTIRCFLYYNDISYDKISGKVNYQFGRKQHAKILKKLHKICFLYSVIVGKENEFSEKKEQRRKDSIEYSQIKKANRAGKTSRSVEKKIREDSYTFFRNKIIGSGTEDE